MTFPLPGRLRYLIALLIAGGGVVLLLLFPVFLHGSFLAAWCVSLLCLLVTGVGPALLAEVIILLATVYFALDPFESLRLAVSGDGARLAIWIACIGLADFLAWRLERVYGESSAQQKALRQSEARYRHVLEQASDGIVLAQDDGHLIMVNQRACEMLEYAESELLRLRLTELYAPGELERLPPASDQLSRTSVVLRERRLVRSDGSTFDAELSVRRTEEGLVQAIIRDITERRRAEEALRSEHALLESILATSVAGILVVTPEGRVIFLNRTAEAALGITRAELADRADLPAGWRFLTPEGAALPDAERPSRRAVATGQPVQNARLILERPDGQRRLFSINAAPIRDRARKISSVVLSLSDITEQERAQQAIAEREEQLRQAQKMDSLGRLAGGVAHDFNNLLTVIRGYADVLSGELSGEDPRLGEVREIRRAADRATSLTRQLLAMSRRQVLQPREVELNGLVQEMERMLRRVLGAAIHIVTESGPEPGWVRADPGQLEQVLLNLTVNARDAMPQGGTLTIGTRGVLISGSASGSGEPPPQGLPPGDYVMLRVADTGIGMDKETLGKIFDPFFTTKPVGEGTGLGLATVYGIVQQSNGAITVESEPGTGTQFRVFLPRIAEPAGVLREPSPPPPAAVTEIRRAVILLVEDDDGVRNLIARVLAQYGYGILEARDGVEALALLEGGEQSVDAVVSDVVMPGMSGSELIERLRSQWPGLPVLFLSGYTGEEVRGEVRLGVRQAFLPKPFSPDALAAAVEELLADARPPATAG
ncbi:MAG TPA: PAS domain S-box protein [Gemmatimonadales bacterium]|nr:PAS domain S-box protein [Gemmatimonadales bacterium]